MGTHLLQDQAADLHDEDGVLFEDAIARVESLDYEVVESAIHRENQVRELNTGQVSKTLSLFVIDLAFRRFLCGLKVVA
jgi:hypothetical protein